MEKNLGIVVCANHPSNSRKSKIGCSWLLGKMPLTKKAHEKNSHPRAGFDGGGTWVEFVWEHGKFC
jgi:hypothetical protein